MGEEMALDPRHSLSLGEWHCIFWLACFLKGPMDSHLLKNRIVCFGALVLMQIENVAFTDAGGLRH